MGKTEKIAFFYNACLKGLPQIRAANFIDLGSKIVTLSSKNYFFAREGENIDSSSLIFY
jgi:hypothetical protein